MTHPFAAFAQTLAAPDLIERLRAGTIGEGMEFDTPTGPRKLVYADYVASGRALRVVEDFVMERVLPIYANSHSEASFCGAAITQMREAGRATIAKLCGVDERYATIFTGAGATSALNRCVALLGVVDALKTRPVQVFIGPYEHHSNILPWRESGAQVIEISESENGGPDLAELAQMLAAAPENALKIGSFSAASNVSGILTDSDAVTRLLRAHGALAVWDYAGAGPYVAIDMASGTDAQKDVIVTSPHKFIGGPAASGLLIINQAAVTRTTPSQPGGGTVRFVSPWNHDYASDLVSREEAGTPNVIGDIRAALAFMVKDAIGQDYMDARHKAHLARARQVFADHPAITILGNPRADRLPIFSLLVQDGAGYADPQDFTRALSDQYGIQARGGCACAGPYGHRLLAIDRTASDQMRAAILAGDDSNKPGFTRLNFSALMTDEKADFIINAVCALASRGQSLRLTA